VVFLSTRTAHCATRMDSCYPDASFLTNARRHDHSPTIDNLGPARALLTSRTDGCFKTIHINPHIRKSPTSSESPSGECSTCDTPRSKANSIMSPGAEDIDYSDCLYHSLPTPPYLRGVSPNLPEGSLSALHSCIEPEIDHEDNILDDSVSSDSNRYTSSSCSDDASLSVRAPTVSEVEGCYILSPTSNESTGIEGAELDQCYLSRTQPSNSMSDDLAIESNLDQCYSSSNFSNQSPHAGVSITASTVNEQCQSNGESITTVRGPQSKKREPQFALMSWWPEPGCWTNSDEISQQVEPSKRAESASGPRTSLDVVSDGVVHPQRPEDQEQAPGTLSSDVSADNVEWSSQGTKKSLWRRLVRVWA
jgi:hypothetical protein